MMSIKRPLWFSLFATLLFVFMLVSLLAQSAAAGQPAGPPPVPYLVKDINTDTLSASPGVFVNWNDQLYFSALSALWASDGTPTGTVPVFDHLPLYTNIKATFATDEKLFFITGAGLWASDGTEQGTELVAAFQTFSDQDGLAVGNTLFLIIEYPCATGNDCPRHLWKSDGTPAGTQQITSGENGGPYLLVDFNGKLYFLAFSWGSSGMPWGLYTSDGTVNGTVLVAEVPGGPWPFSSLTSTDGLMYFVNPTDESLWKSDGTSAGTSQVVPSNVATSLGGLTSANGLAYFFARDSTGEELWQSDGTAVGTTKIAEVSTCNREMWELEIAVVADLLYFRACDPAAGEELWRSDGTAVGTYRVKDIWPGISASLPAGFVAFNGDLFFWARDDVHGWELWRSDGTETGTLLVKDIYPGTTSSSSIGWWSPRLVVGDYLFFTANDGRHGAELWRSDGTEAGTVLVRDINTLGGSGEVASLFAYQDKLFFAANDGSDSLSLWNSDGTAAGTQQFLPQSTLAEPRFFTQSGDGFYFVASYHELWYSNGTVTGTRIVTALQRIDQYIGELTDVNGTLFFHAYDEMHGIELWFTSSTTTTTVMIDINPGDLSSSPRYLTNVNGTLFFQAQDGLHGSELWRSDGTISSTVMVKDIVPGPEGADPKRLINVDGTLFFFVEGLGNELQLWKSDGTEPGTVLVRDDLNGYVGSWDFHAPRPLNGILYFVVYNRQNGNLQSYLWKSDGTDVGTTLVSTFTEGQASNLTIFNETLYFLVDDALWQSDGTAGATTEVFVHPAGTRLYGLKAVNGKLYFSDADDDWSSRLLWQSDGTAAGTFPLSSLHSWGYTGVGDILFFVADDGRRGTELWAINPNRHFFMLPVVSRGSGNTP